MYKGQTCCAVLSTSVFFYAATRRRQSLKWSNPTHTVGAFSPSMGTFIMDLVYLIIVYNINDICDRVNSTVASSLAV